MLANSSIESCRGKPDLTGAAALFEDAIRREHWWRSEFLAAPGTLLQKLRLEDRQH